MKYLKAKKPSEYADELHATQIELSRLREQLRELKDKEESLITYLSRVSKAESFQFEGSDHYLKECIFSPRVRTDIDGDKVRRLLGKKTPFKKTYFTVVSVGWVK